MTAPEPLALVAGHTYRAKRPANSRGLVNDRTILWVNGAGTRVQYDGPAVAFGRRMPQVSADDFRAWASHDVTDQLPKREYAPWPPK